MNLNDLPRGAGTVIFPGNGAWLPRAAASGMAVGAAAPVGAATASATPGPSGTAAPSAAPAPLPPSRPAGDPAVILSNPERILTASTPEVLPVLLDEIEAEQARGCYVAGYLAYEAGSAFGLKVRQGPARPLPAGAVACDSIPLAWMAVYRPESALFVPGDEWAAFLAGLDVSAVAARVAAITPELNVTKEQYTEAIGRVRDYIAAGDTYQVNYTVRARYDLNAPGGAGKQGAAGVAGASDGNGAVPPLDPLEYFLALVVRQAVPYAAYLDLGGSQVLSLSPELFLRRDGEILESRPMKGTRPRGLTHPADVALAYELAETEKERAENLMIVDMVRNDLGRVSRTGTVHVPSLFVVEPYRTVWQMTSIVQGPLQTGAGLTQIMRAVFPGASITGAPKHHTMEIISEVETEPRGVYTGTVALFAPGGDFTGNIGIRTIVHREGRCVFGVGSGVVWDAQAAAEYEETLAKGAFALAPPSGEWRPRRTQADDTARADLGLFETMYLQTDGSYRDLQRHLGRLSASAGALGLPYHEDEVVAALEGLSDSHGGPLVVRLDLDASGAIGLSMREVPTAPEEPVWLLVSPFRVDQEDPLLVHKTTRRGFYDREHRRAVAEGCFDALFVNRLDRVTEGGITNVFARFGEAWVTPPLSDGSLPGVWRAGFIAEHHAIERSLTLDELLAADELVVGNSVRGTVRVAGLIADPLTY